MAETALSSEDDVPAFSTSVKSVSKDSHDKVIKETGGSTLGSSSSAEEKSKQLLSSLVDHVQEKPFREEEARFKNIGEKLKEARTLILSPITITLASFPGSFRTWQLKCTDSYHMILVVHLCSSYK